MRKLVLFRTLAIAAASLFFTGACLAQVSGLNAGMLKLFGENKSFTADSETTIVDPTTKQVIFAPSSLAQLDGKIRLEVDMEKIKNPPFPPGTIEQMKSFNMTHSINIIQPDNKIITFIFPGLTAYFEMPLTQKQVDDFSKEPKTTITELGKETIDGHPCVKNKVVITDDDGKAHDVLLWNATDLNNFPIKMQTTTAQGETTALYKKVKLKKPDAKLFEAPAGYTKYASQVELIQKATTKAKP